MQNYITFFKRLIYFIILTIYHKPKQLLYKVQHILSLNNISFHIFSHQLHHFFKYFSTNDNPNLIIAKLFPNIRLSKISPNELPIINTPIISDSILSSLSFSISIPNIRSIENWIYVKFLDTKF